MPLPPAEVQGDVVAGDAPEPDPQRAKFRVVAAGGAGRGHERFLHHVGHVGAAGARQARNAPPDALGERVVETAPGLWSAVPQALRDQPLLGLIHSWLDRRKGPPSTVLFAPTRPRVSK